MSARPLTDVFAYNMPIGVCWHNSSVLPYPQDDISSLQRIKSLGMTIIRCDADLANLPTTIARLSQAITKAQFVIPSVQFIVILSAPAPTKDESNTALYNRGYTATRTLVEALSAYPIDWELGNEISAKAGITGYGVTANEFTASPVMLQWAQIMRGMSDAVAAAGNKRRLLNIISTQWGFLPFCVSQGINYDAKSYHLYELANWDPNNTFAGAGLTPYNFASYCKADNKPTIITEVNDQAIYTTNNPTTAATNLTNLFYKLHNLGCIESALVYDLYDVPTDTSAEGRFGLFRADGTIKPSGSAIRGY